MQWAFMLLKLCIVFCFSAALTATASAVQYYVTPGESIQAAVDNASDGDMIVVRDGTYIENIDVDKRLTIQSENGSATVQAANISDSVFEVTADHVNISGFTVENSISSAGISLNGVEHCNISNNNLSNNFCAIYSSSSKFNIIAENTLADNVGAAICLYNESDNNQVLGNNISNNTWGVWIGYYGSSSHNIISDNVITDTKEYGAINVYGNGTTNNTITDNYASFNNGVGISLGDLSSNNTVINNNASFNEYFGIFLYSSSYNSILGNSASSNSNNGTGIFLGGLSTNNTVMNNNVSFNEGVGIHLHSSDNNKIASNNANSNNAGGISLFHFSCNNTVINNNASYNVLFGGIDITISCDNNTISNNTASFNSGWGISLLSSDYNTITGNYANYNNGTGFVLNLSSKNTIENNRASYNKQFGIILDSSSYNTVTGNYANSNDNMGIILYNLSSNNIIIDNTANSNRFDGISLWYSSDYNVIRNNSASYNDCGIFLFSSDYNIVINNDLFSNSYGLSLMKLEFMGNSSNNQIRENNLNFNKYCGISLWDLRHFNDIINNNVSNNNLFGIFVCNSTNQAISTNTANLNDRGIVLHESKDIMAMNNTASENRVSGVSLISSNNNTLFNNVASFNTYEGIYLSNSSRNTIANNNVSSNYFGISLYSSNDNNMTDNSAESNYYSEVIVHSSSGNDIVNNTCYIQEEIVYGISLHVLEAITPSLQTVEKGTNASYNIIAENLGNSPDTFDLVLSSEDNPEISSLDMDTVFLGAGEMSINTTITEVNLTGEKTPLDEEISTNTTTIELEQPLQLTNKVILIKPSVKTITLNVSDTEPGIYKVKVVIISRHDNTVKDVIVTRTIIPGQVASELTDSARITKSAIINSSINNSVIDTTAIINSSISDSTIKRSVITNSEVVSTALYNVIVEDANVTNGNIFSGNITINEVRYKINTRTKIFELILGYDHRNSDLVGIKNRTLELNTENSNTRFNICAGCDYFAASMSVQKSSVPPHGIPEFTNNVGGYVYANASLNLVNSTDWLNISVFYDQNELGALDETTLKLRYFNESARSWEDLPVSGIDLTENYVWSNISHYSVFALLAQPAAAGGAYSSSRSSNAPHRRPEEVNIPIANPGMNIFNFEWLGLDILELTTDLERLAIKARVALKKLEKPVEITDPQGIVYGYFEILTNLESENVKSASINFRVSKSWIEDNEIAKIKMCRYNEDWEELKTEKMKEDNKYFYYTAETSGLSIFVITGEKKAEVFTPPTTALNPTVLPITSLVPSATPTLAPPAMLSRIGLPIIAVIAASAMIVLVALLIRRKKKLP
jgi:PGF-pre-PGF domain-containing protein